MVSHRDADKQVSRWDGFLSSFVRGSKGFSQLDRPQISLCDKIKNKPLSSSVRGSKGFSQLSRPRISLCDEKANMLRSESYFKTLKNKKIFTLTVAQKIQSEACMSASFCATVSIVFTH